MFKCHIVPQQQIFIDHLYAQGIVRVGVELILSAF